MRESLNIPVERKERWGLLLISICVLATAVLVLVRSEFAIPFAASSIVALPVIWGLLLPPFFLRPKTRSPAFVGLFAVLFGYLALAKYVLVPFLVRVLQRVIA